MLSLFSCHSCFDLPLLPFIQSFESGYTVQYNVYMLVREQQNEGSPPRHLNHPSNNYYILVLLLNASVDKVTFTVKHFLTALENV